MLVPRGEIPILTPAPFTSVHPLPRCGREDFSQWLIPAPSQQQTPGGVRGLAALPSKKAMDQPSAGGDAKVCGRRSMLKTALTIS